MTTRVTEDNEGRDEPPRTAAPERTRAEARPLLEERCALIADRWYGAIARTSFTPRRAADVRAELKSLTARVIAALLDEPVALDQAEEIGAALARLHYVKPAALYGTLTVLGREMVTGLPAETVVALHPWVMEVMGALAAGYYERSRAMTLDEQDQIRQALFVSRQEIQAAEEARAVAEMAVRVRTDTLNATAHDLRTPVTTIIGHADLLRLRLERDTPPTPEWLRAQAAAIRTGATRIRVMIEELLDVAHLQAGQALELRLEDVDVGALVRNVAQPHATHASGATPVLVDAPPGLVAPGDAARLERVVDNLLSNAIKYSPTGAPVHVEVRPQIRSVTISVRDQGVGIPADEVARIFTPFFRASTARGIAGIGIGLAGAKTIVEQHGGRIAVESAVGQGTTVTLTLPLVQGAVPLEC